MAFRFTRDMLAVVVTSVFLAWVVVTFFGPMLLHVQIDYPDGWMRLAGFDVLAALFCFLGYVLGRSKVPASGAP